MRRKSILRGFFSLLFLLVWALMAVDAIISVFEWLDRRLSRTIPPRTRSTIGTPNPSTSRGVPVNVCTTVIYPPNIDWDAIRSQYIHMIITPKSQIYRGQ
jgi:hypothetical protein